MKGRHVPLLVMGCFVSFCWIATSAGASAEGWPRGRFAVFLEDFPAAFFPVLKIEFLDGEGNVVAEDYLSRDGRGQAGNLASLSPGIYTMRLLSSTEGQAPLYEEKLALTRENVPRLRLGMLRLRLPASIPERDLERAVRLSVEDMETGEAVFHCFLGEASFFSTDGRRRRWSLVLPFGRYGLALEDADPHDAVIITDRNGVESVMSPADNVFELTREAPLVEMDVRDILRLRRSAGHGARAGGEE